MTAACVGSRMGEGGLKMKEEDEEPVKLFIIYTGPWDVVRKQTKSTKQQE